jgi:hypothetical protein
MSIISQFARSPQMALPFANFNFQFDFLLYCCFIVFVDFFHFLTSAYLDQPLSLSEWFVYHVKYQPFFVDRFVVECTV